MTLRSHCSTTQYQPASGSQSSMFIESIERCKDRARGIGAMGRVLAMLASLPDFRAEVKPQRFHLTHNLFLV
jgi:hypothetical protein